MSIITASRLNTLKSSVKAECNRRKYIGSVSSYAGTAYDYSTTPAKGALIKKEIYEKNAVPLNAISGDIATEATSIVGDKEFVKLETKVATLKGISLSASQANTGCAASCTGLCAGDCASGCTGCSGCGSGCSDTCSGDCGGACSNSCTGCSGCGSGCSYTCSGYCGDSCSNSCSIKCSGCSGCLGCGTACDTTCSSHSD